MAPRHHDHLAEIVEPQTVEPEEPVEPAEYVRYESLDKSETWLGSDKRIIREDYIGSTEGFLKH